MENYFMKRTEIYHSISVVKAETEKEAREEFAKIKGNEISSKFSHVLDEEILSNEEAREYM